MPSLDPEMSCILKQSISSHGVQLHLGDELTKIQTENSNLYVYTKLGKVIPSDLVILAMGVKPNAKLAEKTGLELGITGGIKVT